MNSFSARMHKSRHASSPHPTWTIDDVPLDIWVDRADALDLVPAQGWLIDDADFALAWRRIETLTPGLSTIVPVLVCPDDVDLNCSVLVVEQDVDADTVTWRRFGWSMSGAREVGASVRWESGLSAPRFERRAFEDALARFKALAESAWK